METVQLSVITQIVAERKRQDELWGDANNGASDYLMLAILTEEVGEAAQAILHDQFGGNAAGTLKDELVQVGAVVVQWLEKLEKKENYL